MRPTPITGTLVLGLALLAGCADQTYPTAARAGPGPSFDFANNPDNGNPRIVRFGDRLGFLLVDAEANLFSLQAGTNRQFGCVNPPTYLTFHDVQQILLNPDDPFAAAIHELRILSDAYIAVYQGPFPGVPISDCADLLSRKLAEGFGSFRNTDNDLAPFLRDHHNFNAFGFVAQGTLQRVGGGTARYYGVSRCVWDGTDFASIRCKDQINLK
jgi:hypothetical protein